MTLAALTLMGALLEPSAEDACAGVTAEGERARLCMDPSYGLAVAAAGAFWSGSGALDLGVDLRLSGQWESTATKQATWLQLHHVLRSSVSVGALRPTLRAVAYEGHWRRHVAEPYIAVPTTPPIRLPFPFDISFDVSAISFERRFSEGPGWTLEPLRAAVMLDVLRSAGNRFHLAIGPEAHYLIRHDGLAPVHELAPFSGGLVYLWLATEDGRWMLSLRGSLGAAFSVTQGGGVSPFVLQARVELAGERVLMAINDQPLSVTLRAGARLHDVGPAMGNEWSVSAGLSLRFFGSR